MKKFLEGIASLFGFGKSIEDYDFLRGTPEEIDARALRSDWETVGRDIQDATKQFEEEIKK